MEKHEITKDEIIVMSDGPGVFRIAIVALNQKHRQAGDIREWLGPPLPLELANEFAKSEGRRLGLPVTIWAKADERRGRAD